MEWVVCACAWQGNVCVFEWRVFESKRLTGHWRRRRRRGWRRRRRGRRRRRRRRRGGGRRRRGRRRWQSWRRGLGRGRRRRCWRSSRRKVAWAWWRRWARCSSFGYHVCDPAIGVELALDIEVDKEADKDHGDGENRSTPRLEGRVVFSDDDRVCKNCSFFFADAGGCVLAAFGLGAQEALKRELLRRHRGFPSRGARLLFLDHTVFLANDRFLMALEARVRTWRPRRWVRWSKTPRRHANHPAHGLR